MIFASFWQWAGIFVLVVVVALIASSTVAIYAKHKYGAGHLNELATAMRKTREGVDEYKH